MSSQNANFNENFRALLDRVREKERTLIRAVALGLVSSMMEKSPVDTGRFKSNWFACIGSVNLTTVNDTDPTGGAALERANLVIEELRPGDKIYISNSLPYARVLEYGLYGKPPGSASGPKTSGGFSKQSPEGMVRVTVAEYSSKFQEAVRKLK